MKYTAKDIEIMLGGNKNAGPLKPNTQNNKTNNIKYTANDVEKMLSGNIKKQTKSTINLPTKSQQENKRRNVSGVINTDISWKDKPIHAAFENVRAGWNQFGRTLPNAIDMVLGNKNIPIVDEFLADQRKQQEEEKIKLAQINKTPGGNFLGQTFQGVGQAVPYVAQSLVMAPYMASKEASKLLAKGGTQLVTNVSQLANPNLTTKTQQAVQETVKNPNLIPSILRSVGSLFEESIAKGATRDQALNAAITGGIPAGLVEVMGGTEALAKKLATKAPLGRTVLESGLGEAMEEVIQYTLENAGQKIAFDKDMPIYSNTEDALINPGQQAFAGATAFTSSALMGGLGSGINQGLNRLNVGRTNIQSNNQINDVETQNNGLKNQERKIPQVMTAEGVVEDVAPVKEINTKSKAEKYQSRQENYFIENIAEALGISKFADRSGLKAQVTELTNDIKNGTSTPEKVDALFNQIMEDGIQIDFSYYNQYSPLKNSIKDTKIYVSDQVKSDFAKGEYNNFRKTNLKNLTLSNEGIPVDSYYQELSGTNPELFPTDIINPADQLRRIAEVQNSIVTTENNLNMYIDDSGVFEQAARMEFDKAIEKLSKEAEQVKKVQDEKIAKQEAKELDREMVKNSTADGMRPIYEMQKQYQQQYDKVLSKEILTDRDKVFVDWLVKGEITVEDLPNNVNKGGIVKVYQAKLPLENIKKSIKEYNKAHKEFLRNEADMLIQNSPTWKEKKSGFQYQRETMERNIRDIVPNKKEAADIINTYFRPVHENEAQSTKFKNELRDRVRKLNLSDKAKYEIAYETEKGGLPTKREVSERALVQLLGENVISRDMVKQSGADVVKIEKAVNEFRQIYNDLINQANDALIENGYSPVDYRANYFPHFQDNSTDNLLGKIGRLIGLDVNTKELPTDIAGITHVFKPGKRWVGNFLRRTTNETVYDAVEGFDRYIEGVSDVIHHTRDIQRLRALESSLRYMHSSEGIKTEIDKIRDNPNMAEEDKRNRIEELYQIDKNKFPYLVTQLRNYTDNLAGKKSIEDRTMEHMLGRGMYEISKAMENRVAANMVALNPGSWITNFIPIAQGLGGVKTKNMLNGMKDTIRAYGKNDGFVEMSTFLTNRRGSDPLVMTKVRQISKTLSSPMEMIDNFTADSLVRARYYENMNKGMSEVEAMRDADRWTAGVMADRSKGSLPTVFNNRNPIWKTFTMFQTEVNNQLSYMFKDIPDELNEQGVAAIAYALTKVFVASWLYNELYEKLTGRRAAFDPIDIVASAVGDFTDENKQTNTAIRNTARNIVQDVPFFGGLIGGGRVPISSAFPDLSNTVNAATGLATGEMNSRKAMSVLGKEMAKPASYLALPVGGGQVKKAVESISAINKGGSFGVDSQGRDTLQFPAEKTPGNYIKGVLFGKYALPAAKDYVDSGFKSLSGSITEKYKDALENGFTSDEFLRTYEAQKKAESEKNGEGKTIPLSEAANKKKLIDEANPGMSKHKLEQLYKYFDVSEKVWKEEEKKNEKSDKKSTLPTIKGIQFNTKLPTIKDKE